MKARMLWAQKSFGAEHRLGEWWRNAIMGEEG
jgi:hypothetical protein